MTPPLAAEVRDPLPHYPPPTSALIDAAIGHKLAEYGPYTSQGHLNALGGCAVCPYPPKTSRAFAWRDGWARVILFLEYRAYTASDFQTGDRLWNIRHHVTLQVNEVDL